MKARYLRGLTQRIWGVIDGTLHPAPVDDCRGCVEASVRVVAMLRREGRAESGAEKDLWKAKRERDEAKAKVTSLIIEMAQDEDKWDSQINGLYEIIRHHERNWLAIAKYLKTHMAGVDIDDNSAVVIAALKARGRT